MIILRIAYRIAEEAIIASLRYVVYCMLKNMARGGGRMPCRARLS